jgi:hypothetical protein
MKTVVFDMWGRVSLIISDVSEERVDNILRLEGIRELGTTLIELHPRSMNKEACYCLSKIMEANYLLPQKLSVQDIRSIWLNGSYSIDSPCSYVIGNTFSRLLIQLTFIRICHLTP